MTSSLDHSSQLTLWSHIHIVYYPTHGALLPKAELERYFVGMLDFDGWTGYNKLSAPWYFETMPFLSTVRKTRLQL